ncbi:MAG: phosphate ABC transporter substrate-binding/OmpA family protein [Xanthomonadales bacterium]|nr:phosphate ABC transporter substrate-binding/OmpA family protein [Xanthomonadales bacterium]
MFRTLSCCLLLLSSLSQAQGVDLRLHGSNTVGGELAPALVEHWLRAQGFVAIERQQQAISELMLTATAADGHRLRVEIQSHGTSTGFADLLAGRGDLWMASRPVSRNEVEQARSLGRLDHPDQEHVLGLDGLAIVVHPDNPLQSLTLEQLRQVFSGKIRDWSGVGQGAGKITIYARDQQSGTWDTFNSLVLSGAQLRVDARRFESNAELSASVARDPFGIGFSGLAAVAAAKPLAIGSEVTVPLLPSSQTVGTEDYLLARRLFLYHRKQVDPLAQSLVDFALSAQGQRVVEQIGYVPLRIVATPATTAANAPGEYRELVEGASRLSLNFRFGTGLSLLDSKAERDIQRLVAFMSRPENKDRQIRLAGFADRSEGSAFFSLSLSNDRVDYVATRLAKAGVRPQMARGFGGSVPVAPESSALGKLKNRRVEVWLY